MERNAELGISLHIFEQNLLAASVIKLGRPAVGVSGDSLSGFQGAVIFQKIGDAGRKLVLDRNLLNLIKSQLVIGSIRTTS